MSAGKNCRVRQPLHRFSCIIFTFSWLNLSRSLSHAKEDSKRRCSERRSEPALVEAWTCAGILMPCRDREKLNVFTHSKFLLHTPSQSTRPAYLCVNRRLLRLQPRALKVLDLVLLVDLVVSLASRAARRMIPHSVISPLFLHSRDAGRCREVKEGTKNTLKIIPESQKNP